MRTLISVAVVCGLSLGLVACGDDEPSAPALDAGEGDSGTAEDSGAPDGGNAGSDAGPDAGPSGDSGAPDGGPVTGDATRWTHLGYDQSNTYHNPFERTLSVENADTIEQKWSFTVAGLPHAGLTIADGKVFATSSAATYAIDLADGTEIWQAPFGASSTPVYADGAVYVHAGLADLYKLDAETGDVLWGPVKTYEITGADGTSSPVVGGGLVIVGHSAGGNEVGSTAAAAMSIGGVEAFDIETGDREWTYTTCEDDENGAMVWSTVAIDLEAGVVFAATGNNYTIAGANSDAIHAIDLGTGERLWKTQVREGDQWSYSTGGSEDTDFGANPILAMIGDRKVVAAGDKGAAFWVLDRETGDIVWEKQDLSSSHSPANGGVLNNGAYDGEHFFFVSNQPPATAILHAVNASDGSALWPTKSFPKIVWGMPSLANGLLLVPVNNELHIYEAATGELLNMFDTGGTIAAGAPAIADGTIVVKSGMQYIFARAQAMANDQIIAYGLP